MQVSIEVEDWHHAHHLGCILADAEYAYNQHAETWGKDDAVSAALKSYARFFRTVARTVTKQCKPGIGG